MTESKAFLIRIPKDLWLFLKKKSAQKEMSMNQILMECLTKYKEKSKKKVAKK